MKRTLGLLLLRTLVWGCAMRDFVATWSQRTRGVIGLGAFFLAGFLLFSFWLGAYYLVL